MDVGTLRGLIAVITLATFLGICWWAYRGKNRQRFEEDALMPFAEDGDRGVSPLEDEGERS